LRSYCYFVAILCFAAGVVSAVALGQSGATAPRTYPVTWSPDLKLKSLADIPARLKRRFSAKELDELRAEGWEGIPGESDDIPHTCGELLERSDTSRLGMQCAALRALKTAVPAKRSFVHDLPWTPGLFSLLPMNSAWSNGSLVNLAEAKEPDEAFAAGMEKGLSIREFWPYAKYTLNKFGDLVQDEGSENWTAAYIKYASGDFNGDGLEDILIWATGGMAHTLEHPSNLYLLTRTEPGSGRKLTLIRRLH